MANELTSRRLAFGEFTLDSGDERLRGPAKTLAKKRAMSQRALADLELWLCGDAFPAAAE